MAVSLSKGQTVSLTKGGGASDPGLTKLHFGLGWDPVPKKKGFLGGLFGGGSEEIDLDASVIVFDDARQMIEMVWFRKLRSDDGAIQHTGDNLTGEGEGDDESIKVDLGALNPAASALVFLVNSFRGQTFDEVENAFCRVVDDSNDTEIARFTLAEKGGHTGVILGIASKSGGTWSFKAVGEPSSSRSAPDMAAAAAKWL
ncbi:MAG: TerD family protein [Pseudomonadota bacterium]